PPTTPYRSAGAVPTVRERSCLSAAWGSPPRCRRLGSTPAWDGDRYVASPASGFARRVRRRSGRSVRLRPVLGSLLPGSHPTTSTTTHPSPTASLTVQTRQNQGWPSCGSSQSRSRASENHTVAINRAGPCDDQAVLHHEMGLTRPPRGASVLFRSKGTSMGTSRCFSRPPFRVPERNGDPGH